MVSAEPTGVGGASVLFYDGDPKTDGEIFGIGQAAYVRPNDGYKVSATFQAKTCGVHQLFAVINQGKTSEIIRRRSFYLGRAHVLLPVTSIAVFPYRNLPSAFACARSVHHLFASSALRTPPATRRATCPPSRNCTNSYGIVAV